MTVEVYDALGRRVQRLEEGRRNHTFPYGAVVQGGTVTWTAFFNNFDINGDRDPNDVVNPFDLVSPPGSSSNDALDNKSAGFSQRRLLEVVTLHEVGHALGIVRSNPNHPTTGKSVMRSGWGPAKVPAFTSKQIKQLKLK